MLEKVDNINFDELYVLLFDASRKAFRYAQEAHPDETFYAFGLYHHGWFGYIFPTCNTEEALIQSCQNEELDEKHMYECWITARWSPCEWKYHDLGDDFFSAVNDWLIKYREMFDLSHQNLMILTMRRVLSTLDSEKLFGEGEVREKVVLNIMQGDQGPDWIETARLLNPPSTYARWLAEVQAGEDALQGL
jgi:hypothetical protein